MQIIQSASLARGAALIEYAYSKENPFVPSIPDLVGIVAAYIGRGGELRNLKEDLGQRLGVRIAEDAADTFHMFNGRGLWEEGASAGDVRFTDDTLAALYPRVNRISDAFEESLSISPPLFETL